jgi:FixJ family two-component response regulator
MKPKPLVYIVDDDDAVREALRLTLTLLDMEVAC